MKPQGWYRDPFGVHEDRYFSDGNPTKLVRDGTAEAYDEPPPGPLPGSLVEIPPSVVVTQDESYAHCSLAHPCARARWCSRLQGSR